MASLHKMLEALGRMYTHTGYRLPGPWMALVRPPSRSIGPGWMSDTAARSTSGTRRSQRSYGQDKDPPTRRE
jgi:hypothetical protein